jgi:hypothetical protein
MGSAANRIAEHAGRFYFVSLRPAHGKAKGPARWRRAARAFERARNALVKLAGASPRPIKASGSVVSIGAARGGAGDLERRLAEAAATYETTRRLALVAPAPDALALYSKLRLFAEAAGLPDPMGNAEIAQDETLALAVQSMCWDALVIGGHARR